MFKLNILFENHPEWNEYDEDFSITSLNGDNINEFINDINSKLIKINSTKSNRSLVGYKQSASLNGITITIICN